MEASDALIRTKLHLPFTRRELVPRPRLQARSAQGLRGPLTLVTAPAGFGKTALVAACVTGSETPVAWLSLDEADSQVPNDVMGLGLEPDSVAALEERTEGWIAGLQMAALSMRDREDARGFIDKFSGTNRMGIHQPTGRRLVRSPAWSKLLPRSRPVN